MSDPSIRWESGTHFDWAAYDKAVMSGGIISADSPLFSSYAVVSDTYLNFSLKFGYHYAILDTVLSPERRENHIQMRFAGGGAEADGRLLRTRFLEGVLTRIGLGVTLNGDLLDAHCREEAAPEVAARLEIIGRLLGATRLMDMYLKETDEVESLIEAFMAGRSHFAEGSDSADEEA